MNTLLQSTGVTLLVTLCSAYAAWTLMPAGLRRALATALLRLPLHLPEALTARLRQAEQAAPGCGSGCSSCASAAPKRSAAAVQTITFHPRLRR